MISIINFFYLAGCFLLPYTCGDSPRKLQFFAAFVGFSIATLLMGPSDFLHLPNKLELVLLGYPLLGVCQVFVFIPIIPEMIERLQVDLSIIEGENEALDYRLNDQVNEAYTLIYAFASFVSPLIGSFIYTHLGMKNTFDIAATINILFAFNLYVNNCGPEVMLENKVFVQKLNKLKNIDESSSNGKSSTKVKDGYSAIN